MSLPAKHDILPLPARPRCSHYAGRERCESPADVWVISPSEHVAGCLCQPHAGQAIREYDDSGIPALAGWSTIEIELLDQA